MIQKITAHLSSFTSSNHTWIKISSSYMSIVEMNLQLFSNRLSIYYSKIHHRKIFAKNIYRNYDPNSVPYEGVRV